MTRSQDAQHLALDLGAASAGPAEATPPVLLDAAMVSRPSVRSCGSRSPRSTEGGGGDRRDPSHRRPSAAVRGPSLLRTRGRSVTANTGATGGVPHPGDAHGVVATTTPYPLDRADVALSDIAGDRLTGAAVLHVARETA